MYLECTKNSHKSIKTKQPIKKRAKYLIKYKHQESMEHLCECLLLYPQNLAQCLAHWKHTMNND